MDAINLDSFSAFVDRTTIERMEEIRNKSTDLNFRFVKGSSQQYGKYRLINFKSRIAKQFAHKIFQIIMSQPKDKI